ncbi:hypothetical protein [Pararhodobacter oceanensis]|uniref:hypothetical protein n=1 Tax=Pararhodobacter oceanensis TaxID=2172121 RepID=UPI003A90F0B8
MNIRTIRTAFFVAASGAALSIAAAGSAAAQECPQWQLNGVPVMTDADTASNPQSMPMYAGGMLDLRSCGEVPGVGYITAAPNFSLSYDALNAGRNLNVRVEAECDTTLLINTASAGWEFNDDDGSFNPGLQLTAAPSGRYDIWVGTYSEQSCPATLIVQSAENMPAACPDWSLGGAQINSGAGQTSTHQVVAGGQVNLFDSSCGTGGHGYVAQAPDFSLYFDAMGQSSTLTLSANGECDEVMLINDASATWHFNDDSGDLHPAISLPNAASGRYDVWIGTYGASTCASTLTVSSSGAAAAPTAPATPGK